MLAAPKRLFSSANITISDRRNRLHSDTTKAIECLKSQRKLKGSNDVELRLDQATSQRVRSYNRVRCNTIVLRFIVKYWIWDLYVIQYYGSGDFRLEYCSIHGRDTIGHTGTNEGQSNQQSKQTKTLYIDENLRSLI